MAEGDGAVPAEDVLRPVGAGCVADVRLAAAPVDGGSAAGGVTGGGVMTGDGVAAVGSTAALITGMPGPTPAFLTTTFAPNQATLTAMAVPAAHAARPAMTRTMSAIIPHAIRLIRTVRIMARVLIVEDDPYVRSAMVAELTRRAHAVRTAGTALDGIREVSHHPPEVVVLDLGLPDLDGGQALKMIRAITTTPVIVATARDEEAEIIRLLNDGADDYVVKPFSGEHLAARIGALLRRAGQENAPSPVIAVAGLTVDPARREALLDGRRLELSRREFDLLAYLAARPGTVVTRGELLTEVWHQAYGDDQTIDVHVSWLRRKLGETAARPRYLHTVRGVGVMLDPPR
ncbi:MAG: DNA-binding response regulator [Actinomycetia bacterium]|nr:DNA-binding response regulator [Actinomycetes bacterium]